MKKYISILGIYILVTILTMGGCNSINYNKLKDIETIELKETNENIRYFYENLVLVDSEELTISAVSLQYVKDSGVIELIVENKTDKLISISLDKLLFSNIQKEAKFSCDIIPKSISKEYIYIDNINSLENFNDKIEGTFYVLNKDNKEYDFMFKG